jgi:hypothetical protein
MVDIQVVGKRIVITPQLIVDRTQLPGSGDDYTPEQRSAIASRLKDAEKGPFFGPFKDGAEVAAFLKRRTALPKRSAHSKKVR